MSSVKKAISKAVSAVTLGAVNLDKMSKGDKPPSPAREKENKAQAAQDTYEAGRAEMRKRQRMVRSGRTSTVLSDSGLG